jgi:hypothetical protein
MARLRIVTWNCGMALARKAPDLLALNPDIAVVQECSKRSVDVLYTLGFSGLWFGANPNKGLAVFCSKDFTLQSMDEFFGKWVVPVRVQGAVDFNLLAIWACPVGLGVRTITSVKFSYALRNKVAGSPTLPWSSLEISTAIRYGTTTVPDGTTRK